MKEHIKKICNFFISIVDRIKEIIYSMHNHKIGKIIIHVYWFIVKFNVSLLIWTFGLYIVKKCDLQGSNNYFQVSFFLIVGGILPLIISFISQIFLDKKYKLDNIYVWKFWIETILSIVGFSSLLMGILSPSLIKEFKIIIIEVNMPVVSIVLAYKYQEYKDKLQLTK